MRRANDMQCQENIEQHLAAVGCHVTWMSDGEVAALRARKEIFDAAVLVSTGKNMGLAENCLSGIGVAGHTCAFAEKVSSPISRLHRSTT